MPLPLVLPLLLIPLALGRLVCSVGCGVIVPTSFTLTGVGRGVGAGVGNEGASVVGVRVAAVVVGVRVSSVVVGVVGWGVGCGVGNGIGTGVVIGVGGGGFWPSAVGVEVVASVHVTPVQLEGQSQVNCVNSNGRESSHTPPFWQGLLKQPLILKLQ
jgi:hypothetical protein